MRGVETDAISLHKILKIRGSGDGKDDDGVEVDEDFPDDRGGDVGSGSLMGGVVGLYLITTDTYKITYTTHKYIRHYGVLCNIIFPLVESARFQNSPPHLLNDFESIDTIIVYFDTKSQMGGLLVSNLKAQHKLEGEAKPS